MKIAAKKTVSVQEQKTLQQKYYSAAKIGKFYFTETMITGVCEVM